MRKLKKLKNNTLSFVGVICLLIGLYAPIRANFAQALSGLGLGLVVADFIFIIALQRQSFRIKQQDERHLQILGAASLITWRIMGIVFLLLGAYIYYNISKTAGTLVFAGLILQILIQYIARFIFSKKL